MDEPEKKPFKKKGGKPGIQDRRIAKLQNGTCYVTCGYSLDEEGNQKSARFYFGTDEVTARIKRDLLKAEFKRIKAEGHKFWPPEVLMRLSEQGVIGEVCAANNARKNLKGDVVDLLRTKVNTNVTTTYQLRKHRNDMGQIEAAGYADFAFDLLINEVLDEDGELLIRKALKRLVSTDPLKAFEMTQQLWQMREKSKAENPNAQVNIQVNGGNVLAYDASEKIAEIIGGTDGVADQDLAGTNTRVDEE